MSNTRSITYDDSDHTDLNYQGFWELAGTYNATRVGQTGTLASTKDLSASVVFTFPQAAVGFSYYGIKRCCGGSYGICIDCDPNNPQFQTIDAVDPTDDGKNPPIVLFSMTFPTPGVHRVTVRNQADSRFANGNSQLTIDRFVLQVPVDTPSPITTTVTQGNGGGGVTSTTTTSTTSSIRSTSTSTTSPTTSSSSSGSSDTSTTNTSDPAQGTTNSSSGPLTSSSTVNPSSTFLPSTSSESSRSNAPIGAIVGGVLGGLAIFLLAAIFYYWMRLRRIRKTSGLHTYHNPGQGASSPQTWSSMEEVGSSGMSDVTSSAAGLSSTRAVGSGDASAPTIPSSRWGRLVSRQPHRSSPSWSTFSYFTGTATESESVVTQSTPRRELDAGPLPIRTPNDLLDDEGTLPPDYSDIFAGRESSRLSRGTSFSPVRKS